MANKKRNIIFIVLSVLLILSVGYICYEKYSFWKQQKQISVYQQGAQYGYEQTITQIYQSVAPPNCQQVPIFYNNQTINIISVECLQS